MTNASDDASSPRSRVQRHYSVSSATEWLTIGSYVSAAIELADGTRLGVEGELSFVGFHDSVLGTRVLHLGLGDNNNGAYLWLPEAVVYEHRGAKAVLEAAVGDATMHVNIEPREVRQD